MRRLWKTLDMKVWRTTCIWIPLTRLLYQAHKLRPEKEQKVSEANWPRGEQGIRPRGRLLYLRTGKKAAVIPGTHGRKRRAACVHRLVPVRELLRLFLPEPVLPRQKSETAERALPAKKLLEEACAGSAAYCLREGHPSAACTAPFRRRALSPS